MHRGKKTSTKDVEMMLKVRRRGCWIGKRMVSICVSHSPGATVTGVGVGLGATKFTRPGRVCTTKKVATQPLQAAV